MDTHYVIGLDYGTDSVRAVLVDTATGRTVETKVHAYQRWAQGKYIDASLNQFRQHPLDHIEGLESVVKGVMAASDVDPSLVRGICIDTTGSSPLPLDENGTALALLSQFEEDPDAMMVLWKDHTSIREAEEINAVARSWGGEDFTRYVGGIYSSEWFWAKILHIARINAAVREKAYTWMEHCDYMTYLLVGGDLASFKRSRCAAGHKAMWHESWNGLPDEAFLTRLDPYLGDLRAKLYRNTYTSDQAAGTLCQTWADRLGLSTDTVIAVGTFDAHAGAVGAEAGEKTLVRVMGTSTCDIIVAPESAVGNNTVRGICGQVDGSVIPGMIGLEAGQSAFGDVLAWFRDLLMWPLEQNGSQSDVEAIRGSLVAELSRAAEKIAPTESVPVALDWINGRRTPDANQNLKAAIMGMDLGTDAPKVFRALVEAICFGAKTIVERFRDEGVEIDNVVGIGGVAKKSSFVMQTLANVLDMPIKVAVSDQAPALGAAMYAAVAAGVYDSLPEAIRSMGNGIERTYLPEPSRVTAYKQSFEKYLSLGGFVESQTGFKGGSTDARYANLKEKCYRANMELPELDLVVYTFGNVSCVDRENSVFAIKPSGVPYRELSPDDIVIVDFENNIIEGDMRPSSDTKTHALLYKSWPGIGAIAHTHSTHAVAWAQAQRAIPIYGTTHADHLTQDIPCTPPMSDAMIEGDYEHMTGQQIIDHFHNMGLSYEEVEMVLIGNHGPFTWGKTAEKAVYNSKVLEELARMAWLTEQINPDSPRLKDSLIKKHYERKHGANAYYGQSNK